MCACVCVTEEGEGVCAWGLLYNAVEPFFFVCVVLGRSHCGISRLTDVLIEKKKACSNLI